jgi:hypothetical protein
MIILFCRIAKVVIMFNPSGSSFLILWVIILYFTNAGC